MRAQTICTHDAVARGETDLSLTSDAENDAAAAASSSEAPSGLLGRIHPIGLVAVIVAVISAILTLTNSRFLLGNLRWWHWLIVALLFVISLRPMLWNLVRRAIEAITDFTGTLAWILAWVCFVIVFINVVTRYTNSWFERDILFAELFSLGWMSFGMIFLLGVNYGVKAGVNPRIDFWWADFSAKTKAWLDFVLHTALLIPFIIAGLRVLWPYATTSLGRKRDGSWPSGWRVWNTWEKSGNAGELPVGPIQAFLFAAFVLFGLQIFAEVIKTGYVMMGRNDIGGADESDAPIRIE